MTIEPYSAEREWTVEGIPVLTATVSVPHPVPEKEWRRMRRYYQLQCRSYLRYCEKWLLPQAETEYREALAASAPLPCFRAELNYCITYQDDRFLSLYTYSREVTVPGPHWLHAVETPGTLPLGIPCPCPPGFPRAVPGNGGCWTLPQRKSARRSAQV